VAVLLNPMGDEIAHSVVMIRIRCDSLIAGIPQENALKSCLIR
jgi:hypothetical protein